MQQHEDDASHNNANTTEEDIEIKEEFVSNDAWDPSAGACGGTGFGQVRAVTVLTNLQRGNVRAEESVSVPQQANWHTRAAMGEITAQDLIDATVNGCKQEMLECADENGLTALCWAAYYGQFPTVELLLSNGANIEHEGSDGETPLLYACNAGHHEVVKLLLSSGADPNHADHMGVTPLMFAAANDHPHCVSALLEHHATLTTTNVNGGTAYSIACKKGSNSCRTVIERYLLRLFEG